MQVKFKAIEIKVQFTILLENFEQDFRLLMNDLQNLFAVHSSLKKVFRQHFQTGESRISASQVQCD